MAGKEGQTTAGSSLINFSDDGCFNIILSTGRVHLGAGTVGENKRDADFFVAVLHALTRAISVNRAELQIRARRL